VTRTPLSKGQNIKGQGHHAVYSPPCSRVGQLQRWAWERVGRGKLLLRCRLLGGARRFGAHGGGEGRGISWRPPAYSLFVMVFVRYVIKSFLTDIATVIHSFTHILTSYLLPYCFTVQRIL